MNAHTTAGLVAPVSLIRINDWIELPLQSNPIVVSMFD